MFAGTCPDRFAPQNKETMEEIQTDPAEATKELEFDRSFRPHGAIAFFILLVLLGALIWYGIYFLMIQRG